jgi:DNA mismatch endonuclease (patch repair protein)
VSQTGSRLPPPPAALSPAVRAVMKGNRGLDTRPEVALRSALHRRGLRFRKGVAPARTGIRCRADVVFPAARVAVFVDGCFWHCCPDHGNQPATHSEYWDVKLARNTARDRRNDDALTAAGWEVIRVWEHEPPAEAAARIEAVVRERLCG